MPSEQPSELKFEIGHVLFIDIVGYSKLLINEQSEQLQTLKEIVRGTEQFRLAAAEGKLLRLPTGDGVALFFGPTRKHQFSVPWKSPKEHDALRAFALDGAGPNCDDCLVT
jgi:hypothetical protein